MTADPASLSGALVGTFSQDDFFVESPVTPVPVHDMDRRHSSQALHVTTPPLNLPPPNACYNIEEQIGHGSFGQVFRAWDWHCKRTVVIKQVPIIDSNTEFDAKKQAQKAVIEKAAREPDWLEQLDHPAIIKVLNAYEENQVACLVLEYCEGGELFERIKSSGRLHCHFARQVIEQLASALAHAHGRQIAHRDVKPENVVFVSQDPRDARVKLIDWGMAARTDRDMTTLLGTPMYCAPEIMGGKKGVKYSARCDLWSFGVLTYVTLSAKPPFTGSRASMLKDMQAGKYTFPGRPWRNVDPAAKNFVKALLRADPNKRLAVEYLACNQWLSGASARQVEISPLPSHEDTEDWGLPDDAGPSTLQRSRRGNWTPSPGAQLYAPGPSSVSTGLDEFWASGAGADCAALEKDVFEFELPLSLERNFSFRASPGALLYAPAAQTLTRGRMVEVDPLSPQKPQGPMEGEHEDHRAGDDPEVPKMLSGRSLVSRPTLLAHSLGPTPLAALTALVNCAEDCVKLKTLKQCGNSMNAACSNTICYRI